MSVAVTQESRAITEMRLPSPADLGLIKLSHCDNTHVGPKLNCNGNLTLNQYLNVSDTKLNLRDLKKGLDGLLSTDSAISPNWKQKCFKLKYLWLSLILVVIISVGACSLLFSPTKKENGPDYSLNYTLVLISRDEWSKSKSELKGCDDLSIKPPPFVIIGHTVTGTCDNPLKCENIVSIIQSDHKKRGYCDIAYNFLIGDDGYIYEGRGWGIYGAHTLDFNCDSIGVGLIGNFNNDQPTELMFELLKILIEEGIRLNEISPNYKLMMQSQIRNLASPGINVEKELKKWDHWSVLNISDYLCPK